MTSRVSRSHRSATLAVLAGLSLALGACGSGDQKTTTSAPSSIAASPASSTTTTATTTPSSTTVAARLKAIDRALDRLGRPASPEVRNAVIAAARAYQQAIGTGDAARFCDLLSADARRLTLGFLAPRRARPNCRKTMSRYLSGSLSRLAVPHYRAVRVRGGSAYAISVEKVGSQYLSMIDERGGWRVASTDAHDLPSPIQPPATGSASR